MSVLSFQSFFIQMSGNTLIEEFSCALQKGERACLLGRNAVGKSTFLKMASGQISPSGGEVICSRESKIVYLPQEIPVADSKTVFQVIYSGLGDKGNLLQRYELLAANLKNDSDIEKLQIIQDRLDKEKAWSLKHDVESLVDTFEIDMSLDFSNLSGGMKRKVWLVSLLVAKPDIIFLDEPTNHLDLESILQIEKFLLNFDGIVLFVTHDREFMNQLSTRVMEIDHRRLLDWKCSYSDFLKKKEIFLEEEEKKRTRLEKKLEEEEAWISKGVKARRRRNQGRVQNLFALREAKKELFKKSKSIDFEISHKKSSAIIFKIKNLNFSFGDKVIVRDFCLDVEKGDKIGIIGRNASGKSTLIRLLLKKIEATSGEVNWGQRIDVIYFEQLRDSLDEKQSILDNISGGAHYIEIEGERRSVYGYLEEFNFDSKRMKDKVSILSGGEKNRLLLAKLFMQSSNVLVLDEPTNDLDIESLEILEEKLVNYKGCILLVSHDRQFVDNVVTHILHVDGKGGIHPFYGSYSDFLQSQILPAKTEIKKRIREEPKKEASKKGLSYKEKKEFNELEKKVEKLEEQKIQLGKILADPLLYKNNPQKVSSFQEELTACEKLLENSYNRWSELAEKIV